MNPKILFIVPYPFQQAPSQRFRFEQYFDELRSNQFDIEIVPFLDEEAWKILYMKGNHLKKIFHILKGFFNRFQLMFRLKRYPLIFIHREASPIGPPVFEWIIARVFRRRYIYDFDDAIWLPNYSEANALFQRLKMYKKVNASMRWAYKILAGNDYLADYARKLNANVEVIPTTIDTENYHTIVTDHSKKEVVIGWTGSHSTMHYLDVIVPVLRKLEEKYSFVFKVISDKNPEFELQSLVFVPWNKDTEISDLATINIGIMPLTEDQWSAGKCGFKGLQYMALEIPTLMSAVGVNKQIVQNGVNGYLIQDEDGWYNKLEELIITQGLREQIGKAGRKRIIGHYSVSAIKERFVRIFIIALYP